MDKETKEQRSDRRMREELAKLDADKSASPAACREVLDMAPADGLDVLIDRLHGKLRRWQESDSCGPNDVYVMRAINAAARLIPGLRK